MRGPLLTISGMFDSAAGDHTDTYSIVITDPAMFYASTSTTLGGLAVDTSSGFSDDTRLFLWDTSSNPLLGNDDDGPSGATLTSTISDPSTFVALTSTDGTPGAVHSTAAGISLNAGQQYVLTITYYDNDPEDVANEELIDLVTPFTNLYGPNPGAGAFDHWEEDSAFADTTYTIALRGATFSIPEPTSLGLLGVAGLALRRRR